MYAGLVKTAGPSFLGEVLGEAARDFSRTPVGGRVAELRRILRSPEAEMLGSTRHERVRSLRDLARGIGAVLDGRPPHFAG